MTTRSIVGAMLLLAGPAAAQQQVPEPKLSGTEELPTSSALCRGRADPERCGVKWLTEFLAYAYLGDSQASVSPGYRLGASLGATSAVGANSALGLSAFAMVHSGTSGGVQGRYRRFLEHGWVVDVGLGATLSGEMSAPMKTPSLVGDVTVMYRDWIGGSVRVETLRFEDLWVQRVYEESYSETVVLLGGRVGRGPGIALSLAAATALGIAVALCCQ